MAIEIFPGTLKSRLFPAIAAGIGDMYDAENDIFVYPESSFVEITEE
jgi:hypothetical protein